MRWCLLAVLASAAALPAQSVGVRGPEPARVKLGGSADLQVICQGTHDARLLRPEPVKNLTFQMSRPSQATYQINGVVTISLTWTVRIRPTAKGTYRIPPFRVRTGGRVLKTRATEIECVEDLLGPKVSFVDFGLTPERPYIHQPIDVWVRIGIESKIADRLQGTDTRRGRIGLQVTAPWLDDFPGTVPVEVGDSGSRAVAIVLNGDWAKATLLDNETRNGRDYQVVEIRRRFLPNRPGRYTVDPAFLEFSYVTRWRRDLFGDPVAVASERGYNRSHSATLEVRQLPDDGRPADFTNAVGKFQLHGELSKRKFKAGEPVKLELYIAGDGNFEFLDVPELDSMDGWHVFGKKVERAEHSVTATYDLAALDQTVKTLPGISLPYFDPTASPPEYGRAKTDAIPVTVEGSATAGGLEALPNTGKAVTPGIDDIWDIDEVKGDPPLAFVPPPELAYVVWLSPVLLAAAWFGFFRRRAWYRDNPGALRKKRAAGKYEQSLAGEGPLRAFSVFIAERLGWDEGAAVRGDLAERLEQSGVSRELAARTSGLMSQLQASRYGGPIDETGLAAEASELVVQIDKELGS